MKNQQASPYSEEAEAAVCGAILINPAAFYSVQAFLRAQDFFLLRHAYIWRAFERLVEREPGQHEALDYVTVVEELSAMGKLTEIGGPAYLTYITNNVPTSVHAEIYGRLVQRAAIRRGLIQASDTIRFLANNSELTIEAVTAEAEAALSQATAGRVSGEIQTIGAAAEAKLQTLKRIVSSGKGERMLTGFTDLDTLTAGIARGVLIILGGRPGMGKSAFLLTLALQLAQRGLRIAFFSLEMSEEQISERALSILGNVNLNKIIDPLQNPLSAADQRHLDAAALRLNDLPLHIDTSPNLDPATLRAKVRRLHFRQPLDLVIVDYIQLLEVTPTQQRKSSNREQEVAYLARQLKKLAADPSMRQVPVLAATQLSREVNNRQDKRPILSDLRESGAQEQDADQVWLLYRDAYYNPSTEFPNTLEVLVAKNRQGPIGTAHLYYDRTQTRISNGAYQHIDFNEDAPEDVNFEADSVTDLFTKASRRGTF